MDSIDNKHIGKKLRDRRLQLGYTQELAAEKSGISYSYYTKIERGEQLPSIEICVHLAKTFNLFARLLAAWCIPGLPDFSGDAGISSVSERG